MVAEQAFLAPLAPVEPTMATATLAAGTVAVVGEVGGLAVRSCRRRLKATRYWDGQASSAPVTPVRTSVAESPVETQEPSTVPTRLAEQRTQETMLATTFPPGIHPEEPANLFSRSTAPEEWNPGDSVGPVEAELPNTVLSRRNSESQGSRARCFWSSYWALRRQPIAGYCSICCRVL